MTLLVDSSNEPLMFNVLHVSPTCTSAFVCSVYYANCVYMYSRYLHVCTYVYVRTRIYTVGIIMML